jgi:uncharacterized membrane protein YcaP (DUF421 family)
VLLVFLTSLAAHRFRGMERVLAGEPAVIASGGRFLQEAMNRERVQPDEVYAELRKAGFERLSDAKYIVLEDDGKMSIVPASRERNPPQENEAPV